MCVLLFDLKRLKHNKPFPNTHTQHTTPPHTHTHTHPHRWDEMDWNHDGTIEFSEFIYTFSRWVDIDED